MKAPDIFPYKIKNRNLFYNRNHDDVPLLQHSDYWDEQTKKSIEGWWVNDNGTWVFMMPALYWHVNVFVAPRPDEYGVRVVGPLELTDREWIVFTYLLCCMGFSGFTGDDKYTCNENVRMVEEGATMNIAEKRRLTNSKGVHDSRGNLKKYIEPWEYLTRHYLVTEPQGKPLGDAIYDNVMQDAFIFGSRGSAKTYMMASWLTHEFYTGGIKRWADVSKMAAVPLKFGMGSGDSAKVKEFMDVVKIFSENVPGGIDSDGINITAPLFRKIKGTWGEGILQNEYRGANDRIMGSMSKIVQRVYQVNNSAIFVGGRWGGIVEDEVGLNPNVEKSIIAEASSLKDELNKGKKIAISLRGGTSGFINYIEGSKNIFYKPEAYGVFGIPNYWEKPDNKIGLFIAHYYVNSDFKDDNGNTFIDDSIQYDIDEVQKLIDLGMPGHMVRETELNKPNWPSQMFIDGKTSILPSELMRRRRVDLENNGFEREIGDLTRVGDKVEFIVNPRGNVVDNYNPKTTKLTKNNAVSIYERPLPIPGLYKAVYDPIRSDGEGVTDDASFSAVIIYKGFEFSKAGIQNNIVATWLFRMDTLDGNHKCALLLADYYGAKILHEDDVGDFTGYCRKMTRMDALANTPTTFDNNLKISGNSMFKVGIKIGDNPVLKAYLLRLYAEWLETEVGSVDDNGVQMKNVDGLNDLRILDEGAQFGEGNFDMTSAMLILMLWIRCEVAKVYNDKDKKKNSDVLKDLYRYARKNLGYSVINA